MKASPIEPMISAPVRAAPSETGIVKISEVIAPASRAEIRSAPSSRRWRKRERRLAREAGLVAASSDRRVAIEDS
jgi:hypothetical protein